MQESIATFNKENVTEELELHEQLILLRDLTEKTQMLHEAQMLQLKAWVIALYSAKKFQIEIDFENFTVNYKLEKIKGKPDKTAETYNQILGYVKFLLGNNWQVSLQWNSKT